MGARSKKSKRKNTPSRSLPSLSPAAKRRLIGIVLLALGAGSVLSLLFPAGSVAATLSEWLLKVAGWGAMALPVGMLWLGALLLRMGLDSSFTLRRSQVAGGVVSVATFLGLLHLLPLGTNDPWSRAVSGYGGGYLGYIVAKPLVQNLGGFGTFLVLLTGFLVGSGFLFRIHPRKVGDLIRRLWQLYREWREERSREVRINIGQEASEVEQRQESKTPSKQPQGPQQPAKEEQTASAPRSSGNSLRQWTLPPIDIFEKMAEAELSQVDIRQRIKTIEETLQAFGVDARVVEVNQGPAVTQFGVEPAVGVRVARIMALGNDLALRLAAAPLRMEAPVPGKQVVGIEVPNSNIAVVSIREVLESPNWAKKSGRLKLTLGRDVSGTAVVADLTKMPHILIAGSTGSGKSVCLNSFIASMLYQCTPDDLRMIMIDPKMVEMMPYNGIPHLLTPVVTDMEKVVPSLKWVVREMERRYRLFAARGSRNIEGFNKATSGRGSDLPLPYIVVIIDELADLMMVAPDDVEKIICRLAQLARATGIHLVVATQRPSVDVVTGLIKANFPTRISFAVTSQIDSRVILDQVGAEKLLGRGDMLYMPTDSAKPKRLQGTYVSDAEIQELVEFWKNSKLPEHQGEVEDPVAFEPVEEEEESDDLYENAVEIVSQHSQVSVSLLQRKLRIGYNRASRLMDMLEERGIVAQSENGKSREVLIRSEESSEDDSNFTDPI